MGTIEGRSTCELSSTWFSGSAERVQPYLRTQIKVPAGKVCSAHHGRPIKSRPDQDNHKTAKLGIQGAVAQFLKHLSNNLVVSDCREYFPRISLFQAGQRGLTRNTGSGGVLLKIFVDIDPNWSEQAMLGISFHRPFLADWKSIYSPTNCWQDRATIGNPPGPTRCNIVLISLMQTTLTTSFAIMYLWVLVFHTERWTRGWRDGYFNFRDKVEILFPSVSFLETRTRFFSLNLMVRDKIENFVN